ncbi:YkgJ family cysteine cluster protein [Desulfovibrio mangrovi]|uniref:YkgJ family cysteine cluster protein n=1 Tax=Desulfovibrio mangrovi TaxID=2976983 RepID=UPI002246809A|nr:YkgJ family cysteine cluster protein [Desulfovibrio mangrovi]UZP66348.1 YkgJ family cysteine cluster protein [Desulfovibrio mangrovi]
MLPDFSDIFARYEALVAEVDAVFAKVAEQHPQCVTCEKGCSDCCHALFDLSLVEAMYLNKQFKSQFGDGEARSNIITRANEADRKSYKMKRQAYRDSQAGVDTQTILENMARERLRCPLLGTEDSCELYQNRPITCRLYGIPTAIGGKAHTCGKAAFEKGTPYPTVHMDRIQDRLIAMSQEIAERVQSKFSELSGVFVPVSMALLTVYDEQYLGVRAAKKDAAK